MMQICFVMTFSDELVSRQPHVVCTAVIHILCFEAPALVGILTCGHPITDVHAREVIGTRGRGITQRKFTLHDKHTVEGEQKKGFMDGLLGFSGTFPGELLVQWEVRGARPGDT
jgi:hypothetical protein